METAIPQACQRMWDLASPNIAALIILKNKGELMIKELQKRDESMGKSSTSRVRCCIMNSYTRLSFGQY
jgi:hypothetical protein